MRMPRSMKAHLAHALDADARSARQDSVKALRKLFEDFEAQLSTH